MPLTRRELLMAAGAAAGGGPLRRHDVVARHCPVLRDVDPAAPLSVGNGEFAFTADVTGLQSLAPLYEKRVPLCTQSQWGWHSFPAGGLDPAALRLEMFDTYGRQVGYATSSRGQEKLFAWMRENPHRLNLGRLALLADGREIERPDISGIEQKLDLWTGILTSRFRLRGAPVTVRTCCHPERDCVAVSIDSPLALSVAATFPYGSPGMSASDWTSPAKHRTWIAERSGATTVLGRELDSTRYQVRLHGVAAELRGDHRAVLAGGPLAFTCEFSARPFAPAPLTADETFEASAAHWSAFWSGGGAIDLSGSSDRRAEELERRIVLSQYLTAIQCAGSAPPQETGLTCNSWYGKFHLEMHWWHAAHFVLWGRAPLLERSLGWYTGILPAAREKARRQGYPGARWPKMTTLEGRDSPSSVGELLIWQQPHPILMAEMCYRAHPGRATLEKYAEVVMESAEFMAGFAVERDGRYVLGPPLIPAQENHPARETWNPAFELSYWREGLGIARQWRERLGLAPRRPWDLVRERLSALPVKDGVYLAHENCPQTYTERNRDHPSMLAALGMLRGDGVNRETMRRTLHKVVREWRWEDTWGWDFPMAAMTAARLGEPETAIAALFQESPKNTWLASGHNWQRANLPLYLPGNGALLAAVAMMAAAWNGFPRRGWQVRHEGLAPALP